VPIYDEDNIKTSQQFTGFDHHSSHPRRSRCRRWTLTWNLTCTSDTGRIKSAVIEG
jgi:hypothetical protein